jgi:hypothetical protein
MLRRRPMSEPNRYREIWFHDHWVRDPQELLEKRPVHATSGLPESAGSGPVIFMLELVLVGLIAATAFMRMLCEHFDEEAVAWRSKYSR